MKKVCTPAMSSAIMTALKDYTIDQRGDIGSLVRLEATDTATLAISKHSIHGEQTKRQIIATICCLACEKLDRVRLRAAYSLQQQWQVFGLSFSKKPYAIPADRVIHADLPQEPSKTWRRYQAHPTSIACCA